MSDTLKAASSAYLFPYLIDSPEDGGIEERGWLAGDLAKTPREAAKTMRQLYVADCGRDALRYDDRMTFACNLREWHKPTVLELDDEDVERLRAPHADDDPEEIRFNRCQPGEEGAQAWWVCELVPRRWQWRYWGFDLIRAALDGYRHWRITPRIVALNEAVRAGVEDDPELRDRLVRRSRRISRLRERLP